MQLVRASFEVGPSILTGAVTTAVAFFAAGFTNFTGIAELGVIAGGGIILCAIAELVVLPAVICLVDRSGYGKRMPESLPIHALINPLMRMPRLLLFVIVAGTVGISCGMSKLWYDHNLVEHATGGAGKRRARSTQKAAGRKRPEHVVRPVDRRESQEGSC